MWLDYKFCAAWSALAAVDGGFGALLGGEIAHCFVDAVVEAEEVVLSSVNICTGVADEADNRGQIRLYAQKYELHSRGKL